MAITDIRIAASEDRLISRVQDLPPELFNDIYELAFTTSSAPVEIDGYYKPPAQLSVDRRSRQRFAVEYYGSEAGFHFHIADEGLVCAWVTSLHPSHQGVLRLVDIDGVQMGDSDAKRYHDGWIIERVWIDLCWERSVENFREVYKIDHYRMLEKISGQAILKRSLRSPRGRWSEDTGRESAMETGALQRRVRSRWRYGWTVPLSGRTTIRGIVFMGPEKHVELLRGVLMRPGVQGSK